MSLALQHAPLISPEDFLAEEAQSQTRHEYLGGVVYAMAGGTQRHNALVCNISATLHARLRGRKCRLYASDMLLRVERGEDFRFYYPDNLIVCRPAGPTARFQTEASVIFEVLSESTARVDTGEKRLAYLTLPTLEAYVLVDSFQREVTVWRRVDQGWAPAVFTSPDSTLSFAEANCSISLAEIYEDTGL